MNGNIAKHVRIFSIATKANVTGECNYSFLVIFRHEYGAENSVKFILRNDCSWFVTKHAWHVQEVSITIRVNLKAKMPKNYD